MSKWIIFLFTGPTERLLINTDKLRSIQMIVGNNGRNNYKFFHDEKLPSVIDRSTGFDCDTSYSLTINKIIDGALYDKKDWRRFGSAETQYDWINMGKVLCMETYGYLSQTQSITLDSNLFKEVN